MDCLALGRKSLWPDLAKSRMVDFPPLALNHSKMRCSSDICHFRLGLDDGCMITEKIFRSKPLQNKAKPQNLKNLEGRA